MACKSKTGTRSSFNFKSPQVSDPGLFLHWLQPKCLKETAVAFVEAILAVGSGSAHHPHSCSDSYMRCLTNDVFLECFSKGITHPVLKQLVESGHLCRPLSWYGLKLTDPTDCFHCLELAIGFGHCSSKLSHGHTGFFSALSTGAMGKTPSRWRGSTKKVILPPWMKAELPWSYPLVN